MTYGNAVAGHLTRRGFFQFTGAVGGGLLFSDLLAGCAQTSTTRSSEEANVVKIGFLTAFTGLEPMRAQTQFNCFQLAVDEINALGGIGGRQIKTIKEDDRSDPQVTMQKVKKLIQGDKADAIIGLLSSGERKAALPVVAELGGLLFATPSSEGACSKNLISTGQIPSQQVDPFVLWLLKNVGRSVFVVGSDDAWPRGSTESIRSTLERNGGRLLSSQFFPLGATDFRPILTEVRTVNPDILWFMMLGNDSVTFAKQMAEFSLHALLATTTWDEISASQVPGLLTGALTSQAWFMSLDTPETKGFVQRYQKRFGADSPLSAIGEATYDAVFLYKAAVEKAGSKTLASVLKALPDVEFKAPRGSVRVDGATQVVVSNSLIGQVSNRGAIAVHDRLGQVQPVLSGCQLR